MLTKICGMFFKIPLTSILGTYGMGVFNTAYTVYSLLFVLCSAGLPSAIAISVSSNLKDGENGCNLDVPPRSILWVSIRFFGAIGLVCAALTYAFAEKLAGLLNNPESAPSLKALSLCLLFTTVSGVLRGYFQGHGDMVPTALSQVIEAFGKLALGVLFAWYASSHGYPIRSVAAYAVFGVTLSSLLSAVYLLLKYAFYKQRRAYKTKNTDNRDTAILKKLFKTAAPITMSSLVMSIVGIIDLILVMRLLKGADGSSDFANDQYGAYSALATPIFNLPSVMIMPIATAILPVIAGAVSVGKIKKVVDSVLYAIKLCFSVAVPCALGLCFLSEPILMLLYEDTAAHKAAPMLSSLSVAVVFICLISVQGPVLQGVGKASLPMISMLVGAFAKILTGIFLIPRLGIYACALGTLICYAIASLLNGYFIERKAAIQIPYLRYFLHSLICALPATAFSHALYLAINSKIGVNLACVAAIALAASIYLALILLSGYFKIRDIAFVLSIKRKKYKFRR